MAKHNPHYVFYRAADGSLACDIRLPSDGPERSARIDPHSLLRSPAIQQMDPEHRRIVMQFVTHCPAHPTLNLLQGPNGFDLARSVVASGRAYWLSVAGKHLSWRAPASATLTWRLDKNSLLAPTLAVSDTPDFIFPLAPPLCLFVSTATLRPLSSPFPDDIVGEWCLPRPPMDQQAALEFCRALEIRRPGTTLPLPPSDVEPLHEDVAPTPRLFVSTGPRRGDSPLYDLPAVPIAKLSFDYGVERVAPADARKALIVARDNRLVQYARDSAFEARTVDRLRTIGFRPLEDVHACVPEMAMKRDWILSADSPHDWAAIQHSVLPQLARDGWLIEHDAACRFTSVPDTDWYSELESNPKGWFDLGIGICIGRRKVSLFPIVHHLLSLNRSRSMDDIRRQLAGRRVPVPVERHGFALVSGDRLLVIIENLLDIFDRPHDTGKDRRSLSGKIKLDLWRAAEIGHFEQWSASPWHRPAELQSLTERLARVNQLNAIPGPETLRTQLRSYQQWGLAWLQFMREAGFNGILADDMGLGKTIQTLAHLLMEKRAGRMTHPCLIVTPTSVIQNWVDEIERFAPSLRLLVSHGSDRKTERDRIAGADVVLTSYALLRQDSDFLRGQTFSLVILDEAQYIKNHRAQTAQAACALQAGRRLCLTGTPMENHLGELWALFNFLMPGFLGSAESFQTRFRRPIEKDGREGIRHALSRRLAPFVLRRLKSQVEKELPSKTVVVHRVEMPAAQRDLYETVRLAMQARIREEIASRGLSRSHITVLDGLLKLRQVCCDPRLLKHDAAARAGGAESSAKLQALLDMLTELMEEGRRILLFSQFVEMLRLIEAELRDQGLKYSLLTGETRDRAAPVRAFQSGETRLFLISLKAGGTGLNLTAADTVIHYDPWWNPAAENQATDRAHRIGQAKPIFVYRLLTVGTVEARIHAMQERKQKLAESILQEQKADSVSFTLDDVESLFAPISDTPPRRRPPATPPEPRPSPQAGRKRGGRG